MDIQTGQVVNVPYRVNLNYGTSSESISKLAPALLKAQLEMENPKKESSNPYFKSKYADLATVREACIKPLGKNGLLVTQHVQSEQGKIGVRTVLMHESGEWIGSTAMVDLVKPGAQEAGSVITYLRRYMLSAICGLASEDDDDGNAAQKASAKPLDQLVCGPKASSEPTPQTTTSTPPASTSPTPAGYISEPQNKRLWAIFYGAEKKGLTKDMFYAYLKSVLGIADTKMIKWQDYKGVCKWLEDGVEGTSAQPEPEQEEVPF